MGCSLATWNREQSAHFLPVAGWEVQQGESEVRRLRAVNHKRCQTRRAGQRQHSDTNNASWHPVSVWAQELQHQLNGYYSRWRELGVVNGLIYERVTTRWRGYSQLINTECYCATETSVQATLHRCEKGNNQKDFPSTRCKNGGLY